tara:strand:+ start:240 stop:353 length:114 start_codon:yes stop_codon:yes gene_type:complete
MQGGQPQYYNPNMAPPPQQLAPGQQMQGGNPYPQQQI